MENHGPFHTQDILYAAWPQSSQPATQLCSKWARPKRFISHHFHAQNLSRHACTYMCMWTVCDRPIIIRVVVTISTPDVPGSVFCI